MIGLTILAVVFAVYALVAGRLDRFSITAPMVFVVAGGILGPGGTGLMEVSLRGETTLAATEITLALLLFADAATVRFQDVEGDARLPGRLLFVGLPLTIALGAVLAYLIEPGIGWAAAALVATILAPTDAALGLAGVTNRAVPARIRRALNVESGLNDGLATPFVTLFLAMVISEESSGTEGWVGSALTEIGLAVLAAVAVGLGGGWLVGWARSHGWTSAVSEQLAVLALAVLAYAGSVAIGGNGFVAAFLGGLLFGQATKGRLDARVEFSETVALFMSFLVWTVFGALCVGPVLTGPMSWTALGYAVLSLTVVRMLPVALSLQGSALRRDTGFFMGWFGPRGLASVVFTLVVIEDLESGTAQVTTLVQVATWTILLSVVAHGLTAGPLAARYGARMSELRDVPELAPTGEQRLRARALSSPRSLMAWSAFQATKWSGVQADSYSAAGAARTEAVRRSDTAGTLTAIDVDTFIAWVTALAEERGGLEPSTAEDYEPAPGKLSGFLFERFRDEFRPAVDAWIATRPLVDPDAPATPFELPEYRLAATDEANALERKADDLAAAARAANQQGDNYVALTVLFVTVSLFAGVSTKLDARRGQQFLFALAVLVLVGGATVLATFPVQL